MSHSVVIIDRDGNEYLYYPEHEGGERSAIQPLIICSWSNDEEFKKLKRKLTKNIKQQSEMPPELLAEAKEIFG